MDPGAAKFLRLLPRLDCTTIIVIPEAIVLDPDVAALFSGAFGPYRLDRGSALAAIKSCAPRDFLGDRQAQQVLEATGDPAFAREVLRGAAAIAWAASETMAASMGLIASGQDVEQARIEEKAKAKDHNEGMPVEILERLYNQAVEDLALSIRPHVARPAALRGASNGSFDPDLFCCDPDPRFLFERADILRETGARIILAGPSGTGKSALADHLARLVKLEIKQYSGASLFARAWGETEKNIAAAAIAGRGYLTFYDEADALMGNRFTGNDSNQHLTVCATNAFLSAYQDPILGSPVIAATNRVDDLDPAIRRRFDIILTTKVLPEERERIAWERILKLTPPAGWKPVGDTVPGDYVKAARYLELAGTRDAIIAAASVVRARDERREEGVLGPKNPVGFT
ncbi:MAG: ATP-binding protein [Bradyrhizobium sp.]|nr:ATP-binding protein [Bradyrhizobium sp.]